MLKEPLRCTASTSDQSDQLMRWKMRSRRMPALLTRISTRPKAVSAAFTISSAFFGSAIESVEAIASPPFFLISSTTSCAGPASAPAPSRLAPMSQTTTRAPSCASNSAMPRPMPRARAGDDCDLAGNHAWHMRLSLSIRIASSEQRIASRRQRLDSFASFAVHPDVHYSLASLNPTPRPPPRPGGASSPIARPRSARCPPRSRRSRIGRRCTAGRAERISPPGRCGA